MADLIAEYINAILVSEPADPNVLWLLEHRQCETNNLLWKVYVLMSTLLTDNHSLRPLHMLQVYLW